MEIEIDDLEIEHNTEARRFEIHYREELARLEYRLRGTTPRRRGS